MKYLKETKGRVCLMVWLPRDRFHQVVAAHNSSVPHALRSLRVLFTDAVSCAVTFPAQRVAAARTSGSTDARVLPSDLVDTEDQHV